MIALGLMFCWRHASILPHGWTRGLEKGEWIVLLGIWVFFDIVIVKVSDLELQFEGQ